MNDKRYETKILLIFHECYPPTYFITDRVIEYDVSEAEKAVKRYEEALNNKSEYDGVEIKFVCKEKE